MDMPDNKKRKVRAAIFLDKETRDEVKKVAKSNNRTIIGQIKHWLKTIK